MLLWNKYILYNAEGNKIIIFGEAIKLNQIRIPPAFRPISSLANLGFRRRFTHCTILALAGNVGLLPHVPNIRILMAPLTFLLFEFRCGAV